MIRTMIAVVSLILVLLAAGPVPAVAGPAARIFIVHAYHPGQICSVPQEEGFLEGLAAQGYREGDNLVVERFYMDTKLHHRDPDAVRRRGLAAYAAVQRFRPDLLVLLEDNALRGLLPLVANTPLPVVFSGVNGDAHRYGLGRNVTGVFERSDLAAVVRLMHRLLPGLGRVVVFVDDSFAVRAAMDWIRRELAAVAGVAVDLQPVATMAAFQQAVGRLQDDDTVGGLLPLVTALEGEDGEMVAAPAIYRWLLDHSRKPAFAFNDYLVELGLVGGLTMDYREVGRQAAAMAGAILGGRPVAQVPARTSAATILSFNLARARELGITIPDDLQAAAVNLYTAMPVRDLEHRKRLVVVQSYEADVGCGRLMERGMMDELRLQGLREGINLEVQRFSLDSRYTNLTPERIGAAARRVLAAIDGAAPDAVVVFDDNAVKHVMLPLVDKPFPVLFAGMNIAPEHYNAQRRFMESRQRPGHNVTGVTEEGGWIQSLRLMRDLVPGGRTMVVLCSAGSPFLRLIGADFQAWLAADPQACPFQVKAVEYAETFARYQELVLRYEADPEVDLIFTLTPVSFRKADGTGTTEREVMAWVLVNQKKPGGTWEADWVRYGFAAAAGLDLVQCGHQLARKLVRVLAGTPAGEVPIERPQDSYIALNLARLRQLGITVPVDILEAAREVYDQMLYYPALPAAGREGE